MESTMRGTTTQPTPQSAAYTPTDRTVPTRSAERASYDKELVHAILDEAYVCHLGFVRDGVPVVLPTLYGRVGERLYVHGSTGARPLRMTGQADPGLPVCLTVTHVDGLVLARSAFHHSINYRSVVVHGIARQVTDPEEKRTALDALVDHVVPGRSADSRPANKKELAATMVIRLDLDEVSAKLRTGGANDDPEDLDLPHWAGVVPRPAGLRHPAPERRPHPRHRTPRLPRGVVMLVHPWDAPRDDMEWQHWLTTHDFGQLAVNGPSGEPPLVQPLHFFYDPERGEAITHLARPNPLLPAMSADPQVVLSVVDDYAFIPGPWQADLDSPPEHGEPTSFYAAVQLRCIAHLVDDPAELANLLNRQVGHFQPDGGSSTVAAGEAPFGRLLSGIRAVRLEVTGVRAKFKYAGKRVAGVQDRIAAGLVERDGPRTRRRGSI